MTTKIVKILGAGASTPFIGYLNKIITTNTLLNSTINFNNWKKLINKFIFFYKLNNPFNSITIDANEIIDLIKKIISCYNNNCSFDQVLHILEPVCLQQAKILNEISNYTQIIITLYNQNKLNYTNTSIEGWRYIPYLFREIIAYEIERIYKYKPLKLKFNERKLISWLIYNSSYFNFNIYTFNYDPLFLDVCNKLKFNHGFENKIFNSKMYWKSENSFSYIHGATRLISVENKYILEKSFQIAQQKRLQNSSTASISDYFKYIDEGSVGTHYNTWLVSGLEKMESFTRKPFSTIFYKLGKDIAESDLILIIGSSLSDIHINAYLENVLDTLNKKILFVTKTSIESFCDYLTGIMNPNDDIIIKMIINLNGIIKTRGRTLDEALKLFKDRIKSEYLKHKYFYLNENLIVFPDGSKEFYRNKYILRKILWEAKKY